MVAVGSRGTCSQVTYKHMTYEHMGYKHVSCGHEGIQKKDFREVSRKSWVEHSGLEPLTSTLPVSRSSQDELMPRGFNGCKGTAFFDICKPQTDYF